MSTQTMEWLRSNVKVDLTRTGTPWHGERNPDGSLAANPNHYNGAVPLDDVVRDLFPWEPTGAPISVTFKGENVILPGYKAWLRDDTGAVMGIHTDGYVGHGYRTWLLENVSAILKDDLSIISAGLLDDGAKAWVQVGLPESVKVEGVEYRATLFATTSLDGSIATTYKIVITMVICDNTRAAALGERGNEFRVKHTKNSGLRIMEARDALGIIQKSAGVFGEEVQALLAQKITPKQAAKFWDAYAPIPETKYANMQGTGELFEVNKKAVTMATRKRDNLIGMYQTDNRVAPWKGTAFGILQAVNTYEHHESRANKGTVRLERNMLRTVKGEYESLDRDTNKVLQAVLA